MKLVPLALALTLTASAFSQATFTDPANLRGERVRPHDGRELPVDQGASGLQQLLRKLNTRASILNIVAHPDDEDGGMLTFYSRGLGARVADLALTRGEGGQNAMTGDFEDALGLLRTQELLANDRYVGVDQMFGTEVDFGFSKTKEEAFAKWTHERVLYDAVRAIRLYRPLVITATFIGGVTDGHGQHQVSGQIAQEAFKAAADPKVFPEMIAEGLLPWQALKIYARVPMQSISSQGLYDYATGQYAPAKFTNYVTGEVTTTQPSVDVVVHEGTPDALLGGKSYVQFARMGLGMQKSQIGPGVRNAPGGTFDVSYHRYGSRVANQPAHEDSFFDGIDTSIAGIASLAPSAKGNMALVLKANLFGIRDAIQSAQGALNTDHPEGAAYDLAKALKLTEMMIDEVEKFRADELPQNETINVLHELRIKRVQLNDALAIALGLHIEATTQNADVVTKTTVPVHVIVTTDSNERTPYFTTELETSTGMLTRGPLSDGSPAITKDRPWTDDLTANPPLTHDETRPYYFRENIEQSSYQLHKSALRNAPATPPALTAWVNLTFNGTDLKIGHIVEAKSQPVAFVPPASLSLTSHAQVLPKDNNAINVQTFLQPIETPVVVPELVLPAGWKSNIAISDVNAPGQIGFALHIPTSDRKESAIKVSAKVAGQLITEGYRPVGYGDLPRTNFFTPATDRIVPVDLKLPTQTRIAYLPGTGDDVPSALASIGLAPKILSIADLTAANLAKYDTVILGVRTYNAHRDLHGAPTQALFDYARNGGNVVVQYQTTEFTAADAPFPLALGSNEKVVDETAPVQLLGICDNATPAHSCEQSKMDQTGTLPGSISDYALLTTPNRITPADFNNWVEERGHGFLSTWDSHYTALTETHDPGGPETQPQSPQRGGLITTTLGKGRWTYCAFALYRQLPEAVPGAYRLFVNLLNP